MKELVRLSIEQTSQSRNWRKNLRTSLKGKFMYLHFVTYFFLLFFFVRPSSLKNWTSNFRKIFFTQQDVSIYTFYGIFITLTLLIFFIFLATRVWPFSNITFGPVQIDKRQAVA